MISDLFNLLWSAPVRTGPVVLGVLGFALVNGLRRWFRIQYMPSYFAVFPVSLLDPDVARFSGTGWADSPEDPEARRRIKRQFLIKTAAATVVSFVVIPLVLGFAAAFYMTPRELLVVMIILLVWQGYAAYQSTSDNTRYTEKPVGSAALFSSFYVFYLASLVGFIYQGFSFTRPYVVERDWGLLVGAVWDFVFTVVIAGGILAGLSGVLVYLITERDVL